MITHVREVFPDGEPKVEEALRKARRITGEVTSDKIKSALGKIQSECATRGLTERCTEIDDLGRTLGYWR